MMIQMKHPAIIITTTLLLLSSSANAFTLPRHAFASSSFVEQTTFTYRRKYVPLLNLSKRESNDDLPFYASKDEATTATKNTDAPSSSSASSSKQEQVVDESSSKAQQITAEWSAPMTDAEMSSDDPFVQRIDAQIFFESGVGLDGLLNPAKVVNLERDLYNLRSELASLTGKGTIDISDLTTEECDGGGGGAAADSIRKNIEKKEKDLFVERRSVFRGWLKNVFLGQAMLSLGLSWIMVTNPAALFGSFDWFNDTNSIDVSIRVLGFWWWWLFIVPSLRSRRPSGAEKTALDIAFVGTPLISLLAPIATKDTAVIWCANLAVVAGAYAFAFLSRGDDDDSTDEESSKGQGWLKFVYKSLDVGTGRERGVRK